MALRGIPSVAPEGSIGKPTGATNLITNGGFETDTTGWATQEAGCTPTRSNDYAAVGSWGCTLTPAVGAGWHYIGQSTAITAAQTITISAYAKQGVGRYFVLVDRGDAGTHQGVFDLQAGTVSGTQGLVSSSITAEGDGYRCRITYTATNSYTAATIGVGVSAASTTGTSTTGGTETIFVDAIQIEVGTAATPYIETDGGTATRQPNKEVAP